MAPLCAACKYMNKKDCEESPCALSRWFPAEKAQCFMLIFGADQIQRILDSGMDENARDAVINSLIREADAHMEIRSRMESLRSEAARRQQIVAPNPIGIQLSHLQSSKWLECMTDPEELCWHAYCYNKGDSVVKHQLLSMYEGLIKNVRATCFTKKRR